MVVKKSVSKAKKKSSKKTKLSYVLVRSNKAGVFVGNLAEIQPDGMVKLNNARRIWYWSGAASLSQLATDGVSRPLSCKFPCEVESIIIFGVIEIIPVTEKAKLSIQGVPVWSE